MGKHENINFTNANYLMERALNEGIISNKELANFMAQMQTESNGFHSMVENIHYSAEGMLSTFKGRNGIKTLDQAQAVVNKGVVAIGDAIYGGEWAKRNKNGNIHLGDGYKYRGRGYTQLTEYNNYMAVGKALGLDLVNHPELVEKQDVAIDTSIYYYLNDVKDKNKENITAARYDINNGKNGLPKCKQYEAEWEQRIKNGYIEKNNLKPRAGVYINHGVLNGAISIHDEGEIVRKLNHDLSKLGFKPDHHNEFNLKTKHAVENFQHENKLEINGIVDKKTMQLIHDKVHELEQNKNQQITPDNKQQANSDQSRDMRAMTRCLIACWQQRYLATTRHSVKPALMRHKLKPFYHYKILRNNYWNNNILNSRNKHNSPNKLKKLRIKQLCVCANLGVGNG